MGLSEFIEANQEALLAEFQEYVLAHLPPGVHLSGAQARNYGSQVLVEISGGMRRGVSVAAASDDTPAERHGSSRRAAGFDVNHVLGEYRMLRATVMRMWLRSRPPLGAAGVEDLVRFNEVIDQAVAESVAQFGAKPTKKRVRK
jgi:hypothetical protein